MCVFKTLWVAFSFLIFLSPVFAASPCDDYLELEEVRGDAALEWVSRQNAQTLSRLQADPRYQEIYDLAYAEYTSKDRLVWGRRVGNWVYNFWMDETLPLGVLRRTTPESYLAEDGQWQTIIDFNQLPKHEGKRLIYKGSTYSPNGRRVLLRLSPGGGDNVLIWEYDLVGLQWVRGGFRIPESKSYAAWLTENTILLHSNLGKRNSTRKSYPRRLQKLRRGLPLDAAEEIFAVGKGSLSLSGMALNPVKQVFLIENNLGFDESQYFLLKGEGEARQIPLPSDAKVKQQLREGAILELQSEWSVQGKVYSSGALLKVLYEPLLRKSPKAVELIFDPRPGQTVEHVVVAKGDIYLGVLENVKPKTYVKRRGKDPVQFQVKGLEKAYVTGYDWRKQELILQISDSIHPFTSYRFSLRGKNPKPVPYKMKKPKFDSTKYEVKQLWAKSKDGTQVPYFVVAKKGLALDGSNPVFMYGYGGFGISQKETYLGKVMEEFWLSRGGVYVLGNARGGGELGPDWHFSAVKENKQKTYDDFIAIAEHLVELGYTSARKVGFMGGSNGGLTSGALLTQRPDLFGATIISVPLLDMLRFHLLKTGPNGGKRVGASWMDEYGNPDDPAMRPFIQAYSPFHNVKEGVDYPEPFFMTSTMDDRVHPGHARKMAKRMQDLGYPILYFENIEGGHGGAVTYEEYARAQALRFVYLLQKLMDPE